MQVGSHLIGKQSAVPRRTQGLCSVMWILPWPRRAGRGSRILQPPAGKDIAPSFSVTSIAGAPSSSILRKQAFYLGYLLPRWSSSFILLTWTHGGLPYPPDRLCTVLGLSSTLSAPSQVLPAFPHSACCGFNPLWQLACLSRSDYLLKSQVMSVFELLL